MVQKNLIIVLALLWIMPQFMAKRSVMTKFRKMHKVDYSKCNIYRTCKDGEIDLTRQKRDTGIQYRHEKK